MMAKYDVTHTCGHVAIHALYGPVRDRQRRIGWLEGQPCTECWREQQQSAAEATSQEMALPALKGTEKQIAWAERIRAGFLSRHIEETPMGQDRIQRLVTDVAYEVPRGDAFLSWAQERGLELGSMVVYSPSGERRKVGEEVASAMRHLLVDWAGEADSAAWWIDNREDLHRIVKRECHERLCQILREIVDGEDAIAAIEQERRTREAQQEQRRAEAAESQRLQAEAEAEATIRPENERSPLPVVLSCSGKQVRVAYPEKDERLRTLMRGRGFSWSQVSAVWFRDGYDEAEARHLLVEIGVKSLSQRLPVTCIDADLRARIVAGDYAEEPRGTVAAIVSGPLSGQFCITWDRDRGDYYDATKRLRGAKWDQQMKRMVIPAASFEMVLDFAARNGFRLTPGALEIAQREQDKRAAEMVISPVTPRPETFIPAPGAVPAPLSVPDVVEIPASLRDEAGV